MYSLFSAGAAFIRKKQLTFPTVAGRRVDVIRWTKLILGLVDPYEPTSRSLAMLVRLAGLMCDGLVVVVFVVVVVVVEVVVVVVEEEEEEEEERLTWAANCSIS